MILKSIVFVAHHVGPFKSLLELYKASPAKKNSFILGSPAAGYFKKKTNALVVHKRQSKKIETFLKAHRPIAVLRGTSVTKGEFNVEEICNKIASKLGIPVFAIEDFPDNYRSEKRLGRLEGLFVEFSGARNFGRGKRNVHSLGNPRYDRFFPNQIKSKRKIKSIFWAGQPDDGASYRTFQSLAPHFSMNEIKVFFKAHPRDSFYKSTNYNALFRKSDLNVVDLTRSKAVSPWKFSPDLLVTRYSSLAVEAGFYGIPAAFVLFKEHKDGPSSVPWAKKGGAIQISSKATISKKLKEALENQVKRRKISSKMRSLLGYNRGSTKRIWKKIHQLLKKR